VKIYTKYNPSTGEIEYTFEGTPEDAELNQPNVEGKYVADEYIIVDKTPVRKSDDDINQVKIDKAWLDLKNLRNAYLLGSDFTQGVDAPLTDAEKSAWAIYRNQLRDLPNNTVDPLNPVWPSIPA
tara:strand:+ start:43 stop:417 length:375 start_codon:yes stop_codon:yes gene_type:complete